MEDNKKVIFSGIQPSGTLTLGNYIGAIGNWLRLQEEYRCYFCIVDMHAITVRQQPADLRKRCLEVLAIYLAAGLDPDKCSLFFQSHVSAHAELAWVLSCNAYMGEMSRMTQFKEKSAKQDNVGLGLYSYPVLMAADILLYNTDLVPVGADQKQHLELARDLAIRFNNAYGETFVVPEPYIAPVGARIMSLQEPEKKMSKSDENVNSFISLLDDPDTVRRKFRRAVTDSGSGITASEDKPGIRNLLSIYCAMTGQTVAQAEATFANAGYGEFKDAVADAVIEKLTPFWERYHELIKDKAFLEKVFTEGSEAAAYHARRTLSKVYRKIGFAPRKL